MADRCNHYFISKHVATKYNNPEVVKFKLQNWLLASLKKSYTATLQQNFQL